MISKITYTLPYLHLKPAEEDFVNTLLRRVYKYALGIACNASNARLHQTGVINTLSEITEAHLTAQYARLATTSAGRHILATTRINFTSITNAKHNIPHHIHNQLLIPPLPKNMHPTYHTKRRIQRAKALQKNLQGANDVLYVDAAEYPSSSSYALSAVDTNGKAITTASVTVNSSEEAEEAAIALGLSIPNITMIVSDSKTAIRNFSAGRISQTALSILNKHSPTQDVALIWTPAHAGLCGNEAAHACARGMTGRAQATDDALDHAAPFSARDRLLTFHDITNHYRLQRTVYPPLHRGATRHHEILWRQLQTRTFPTPSFRHLIHPAIYPSPLCIFCQQRANLDHIMWGCTLNPPPNSLNISSKEQWEAAMCSSAPEVQDQILDWAKRVAETYAG